MGNNNHYAGEIGLAAGFFWATVCNMQRTLPWYKRPWTHVMGMTLSYHFFRQAAAWEDHALKVTIERYERRGYVIPEDRKKLFDPDSAHT